MTKLHCTTHLAHNHLNTEHTNTHIRATTRTRNFCKFCATEAQYPTIFIPAWNFCETCKPVLQNLELLLVLKGFYTRTRNFCEFCTTFIPAPGTSVSSVRPVSQYPGYWYNPFIPHRNFCEFFTPGPQYPGRVL